MGLLQAAELHCSILYIRIGNISPGDGKKVSEPGSSQKVLYNRPQVSRLVVKISRILTKIEFAKILSVFSKENPYVFVKCETKKRKSPQFVVQIKVVVQFSIKNWAILAINSSGKFFLKWSGTASENYPRF